MPRDEISTQVLSYMQTHFVDTQPEVHDFRVPGERRDNEKSPTAGKMHDCIAAVSTALSNRYVSRKRVRRAALRLLLEGAL